jgi:hypothetical protein
MQIRGVNYDVGTHYGAVATRPDFDTTTVQRDMEIIKNDLHCTAIRISGQDADRLIAATEEALRQGLEVWLSPLLHDKDMKETLAGMLACAIAAEKLRQQWPRLVFVTGCELTIFTPDIMNVPGNTVLERLANPAFREQMRTGAHNEVLNKFLAQLTQAVREVFHGRVTYASVPIETVDWNLFDFVCLDYYRSAADTTTIEQRLKTYLTHDKPVVITEVGCCTFEGAEKMGGMGWSIIDQKTTPVQRLNGDYVRNEELQAREVIDMLHSLDEAGAAGAFVYTFVIPAFTYSEDAKKDLDMASYGLVKSLGKTYGVTYPDTHWEPKKSFTAVADFFSKL